MSYELFCQFVIGASHIRKNIVCEDFGLKRETETCKIFVLGDGHGDSNCPRSSRGSELICTVAAEYLEKFANRIATLGWKDKLFEEGSKERLIRGGLIKHIVNKWSMLVRGEYEQNPLTEKEKKGITANFDNYYRQGKRLEHIYGTTLIAGLVTKEYLILLQQGDGRCILFHENGKVEQPIPWDEQCFANVTTSVCDENAVEKCRYCVIDLSNTPVLACVAGSDGVEDSFASMEAVYGFYQDLLKLTFENDMDGFENELKELLPELSEKGSGDDVTICGFVDKEAFRTKLVVMERQKKISLVKLQIRQVQERLDSMQGKLQVLKTRYDAACAEYAACFTRYEEIKRSYEMLEQDVLKYAQKLAYISVACLEKHMEDVKVQKDFLWKDVERLEEKKNAIAVEYLPYREKYEDYMVQKEENQKQLDELVKER